jgi:hypothetical protein
MMNTIASGLRLASRDAASCLPVSTKRLDKNRGVLGHFSFRLLEDFRQVTNRRAFANLDMQDHGSPFRSPGSDELVQRLALIESALFCSLGDQGRNMRRQGEGSCGFGAKDGHLLPELVNLLGGALCSFVSTRCRRGQVGGFSMSGRCFDPGRSKPHFPFANAFQARHDFRIQAFRGLARLGFQLRMKFFRQSEGYARIAVFFHADNLHQNSVTKLDTAMVSLPQYCH